MEGGQLLRILTVEDEHTREGLAVEVDRTLPASTERQAQSLLSCGSLLGAGPNTVT